MITNEVHVKVCGPKWKSEGERDTERERERRE